MAALKETLETTTDWLKEIFHVGLNLAIMFLVVDILFGETTGIAENLTDLIESFINEGPVGLIAFIVFVIIYEMNNENETDIPPPR